MTSSAQPRGAPRLHAEHAASTDRLLALGNAEYRRVIPAQFFTVVGKTDNEIPEYAAMPQMEE